MDKLKPILAQKFWIFFGIVLIMPLAGYFMTKGDLAAQIETRTGKLKTVYDQIPKGTDSANELWVKAIADFNEQQKLHNRMANKLLWEVQAAKIRFPAEIADVMKQAEYFKPLLPEKGGRSVPFKYQMNYTREIRRLWEIVDPLDDGMNLRDSAAKRKVAFTLADLQQANPAKWEAIAPTFDEIWGYQEDIWLQTELLSAIARVNANAQTQIDAYIRQLGKITLFGGSAKADAAASAAAPAGSSGMTGGDGGFGTGMMGGGGRQADAKLSAEITLGEEFTPAIEVSGGGGGGAASGGMTPSFGGFGGESSGGTPSPAAAGGGAKTEIKRYLDDDETQPYKRRGFYFKVVMDHRKVPDLLAELMNSPYPVEIVRVHQTWYSDGGTGTGAGPASSSPYSTPPSFGGTESFVPTATSGEDSAIGARPGAAAAQSAMADPNLASVAILGVWTLYRPPPADSNPPAVTPSSAEAAPATVATSAAGADGAKPPAEQPSDAKTASTPNDAETPEKAAEDGDSKKPAAATDDSPASENDAADKKPKEPAGQDKPAEPKTE